MVRAAKRLGRRIKENPFSRLPGDTISDILLRLPAKYVLRAGAVCKAWRSVTTEPSFLAAPARLQPAQVVLYTYMDAGCYEMALDVVLVSSADDEAPPPLPQDGVPPPACLVQRRPRVPEVRGMLPHLQPDDKSVSSGAPSTSTLSIPTSRPVSSGSCSIAVVRGSSSPPGPRSHGR